MLTGRIVGAAVSKAKGLSPVGRSQPGAREWDAAGVIVRPPRVAMGGVEIGVGEQVLGPADIMRVAPALLRLRHGESFKRGPWHLGEWSYVVGWIAGIYWLVPARNWFTGPKVQGTADELAAIESELSA